MSGPVDVLAVMDAATSRLLAAGESTGESVAARAAVVELVEALDKINDVAANRHAGFGAKENRRWIWEISGSALARARGEK